MAIGDKIPVEAIKKALAENPVLKWAVIGFVAIFAVDFVAKEATGLIKIFATLPQEIITTNRENCAKERDAFIKIGGQIDQPSYKEWRKRCTDSKPVLGNSGELLSPPALAETNSQPKWLLEPLKWDDVLRGVGGLIALVMLALRRGSNPGELGPDAQRQELLRRLNR